MIYEVTIAYLMPDGVPVHLPQQYDEPWIDSLDEAMKQSQLRVDQINRNLLWGRSMDYGWAHKDGERRLVGGRLIGPSKLHRWSRDTKDSELFYCAGCGVAGAKTKEVPITIQPIDKKKQGVACSNPIKEKR